MGHTSHSQVFGCFLGIHSCVHALVFNLKICCTCPIYYKVLNALMHCPHRPICNVYVYQHVKRSAVFQYSCQEHHVLFTLNINLL